MAINAPLTIDGVDQGLRATLCRCEHSKTKPFCDGRHAAAGFTATGETVTQESHPLDARGGAVNIASAPNGPLLVSGNTEVVSGNGRTTNPVTKTTFYRCGQSVNKPYCDGIHTENGFKS